MRNFIIGTLTGALLCAGAFYFVGRAVLVEKYEHGRLMGQLDGRHEALTAIQKEFGEVPWSARVTPLFSLKTSVAVATVVDGVKTIRVVP